MARRHGPPMQVNVVSQEAEFEQRGWRGLAGRMGRLRKMCWTRWPMPRRSRTTGECCM
jgi:hypothetical protein